MSQLLHRKIAAIRTKHAGVSAGVGLTMAASVFVTLLAAGAAADWVFKLDHTWRAGLLALYAAVALYCVIRYAVVPIARRADDESLALLVERIEPSFRTRLIAAIQFARPGALTSGESPALVAAMVRQTEDLAKRVNFKAAVRADRLARWTAVAAVVFLAAAGAYAAGGENTPILLRRAFLQEVALPQRTYVKVTSGSFLVATGEPAQLAAEVTGWTPERVMLDLTFASGRKQTVDMKEEGGVFGASVSAVAESFRYRVRANDGTSDEHAVTAEDRPSVQAISCVQIYPAYTGIGESPRQPADLLLLAGSRLRVTVRTNKPLAANADGQPVNVVRRHAQKDTSEISPVALIPDSADPLAYSAELAFPENIAGISLHLLDRHGLESKNSPYYPVDLLPDRAPTVRITAPDRREILVTAEANTSVGFLAEDDFGLVSLALKYRINEESEQTVALAINAGDRTVRGYYPWEVGKLPRPADRPSLEGCVVEFWIEARDANIVTGPGVTSSEHYQLRIVSKSDKQAELIARMAESFSNIHGVSDSQESAATELGAIITEQRGPETRP